MDHEEYAKLRDALNPIESIFEVPFNEWNRRFDEIVLGVIGTDDENYLGSNYKLFNQKVLGANNVREKARRTVRG